MGDKFGSSISIKRSAFPLRVDAATARSVAVKEGELLELRGRPLFFNY